MSQAMTEHVRIDEDDPIHSLLEFATNGGYHINKRVHERIDLFPHPEPGIAATTGDSTVPDKVYTGPCLMSPIDSRALKQGYDPTTFDPETNSGERLDSYGEFVENFLHDGGIPRLSQIIDHWGIQGMDDGTVVLMLEDEEWTDKVEGFLRQAGIEFDHDQVFEDVHTAYGTHLQEVFRAYVCDLLDNDVEILPVFTSEHSENIDALLEESTRRQKVSNNYDDEDHYFQRIAMYTTPLWLDYLETELGLPTGSLDISDPIRFYDEFYNYEGSGNNIFLDYQIEYFAGDNDDRDHELLFVPPVLAPFGEGYELESHADHRDAVIPHRLPRILSRLETSTDDEFPNLLESPLVRLLTGFPNRADLAARVIHTRREESEHRPEWKAEAMASVAGATASDDEIARDQGVDIRSGVQKHREQVRQEEVDDANSHLVEKTYKALVADLRTVLSPSRRADA